MMGTTYRCQTNFLPDVLMSPSGVLILRFSRLPFTILRPTRLHALLKWDRLTRLAMDLSLILTTRWVVRGGYGGPFKAFFGSGYFFSAKLSATRCSAMEATGETAPLEPALGSGGLGLG